MIDPAIVDLDRVATWMDERGLEYGPLIDVELIDRRHAEHPAAVPSRSTDRSCCADRHRTSGPTATRRCGASRGCSPRWPGTDVPHPALIAAEPDEAVIGAAFFLMEPIDGYNVTLGLRRHSSTTRRPARDGSVDGRRDRRARHGSIRTAQGIADLGKWDGWGERQVPRWRKQLDSYA